MIDTDDYEACKQLLAEIREAAGMKEKPGSILERIRELATLAPTSGEGVDDVTYTFSGLITYGRIAIKPEQGATPAHLRNLLRQILPHLEADATPQSAPADGVALSWLDDVLGRMKGQLRSSDAAFDWKIVRDYHADLCRVRNNLTTPPPASQEGGGKPWRREWEGSGPQRGWHIVEAVRLSNNERIAYLGPEIDSTAVDAIVAAHNATQRPVECADGCPPQQVCDFCQGTGGTDASPPSSAAFVPCKKTGCHLAGGSPCMADDCPNRPGAAEQAKPMSIQEMFDAEQPDIVDAVDDPNGECPTCRQSLHVEQAQAGELQSGATNAAETLHHDATGLAYEIEAAVDQLRETGRFVDDEGEATGRLASAAAILRRLAGGVTVDDAMAYEAITARNRHLNAHPGDALGAMRAALVAALGAK